MSSAVVPTEALLTRREIRALERERVVGVAAESVPSEVPTPEEPEVAVAPEPADEFDVVEASISQLPMGGTPSRDVTEKISVTYPSRRSLRENSHGRPTPQVRELAAKSRVAPRAAILTSLGVLTIAAPLTGFVTSTAPASAIGSMIPTQVSVLDVVDSAAAARQLEGAVPTGSALAADPTAMARAAELASREQARTGVSVCEPVTGASGMREAFTERASVVYRPMAEGTYRDTSPFGPRWGSFHYGTDMAASAGTPIFAIADGEVIYAGGGKDGRSGQLVIIHHVIDGQDVWSWYGHMYTSGVYVSAGDKVTAGQLIAGVGSNGNSTGPHLHFEIHTGEIGNHVDPLQFLADAGAPHPTAN